MAECDNGSETTLVAVDGRTIYMMGEITEKMAFYVLRAIEQLDKSEGVIRIVLNSEGGAEVDGYVIYDAITMCKNPVHIDGYGDVCSIAVAIFQACDYRRLSPHAQMMIHNGTIYTGEDGIPHEKVLDMASQMQRDNQKYYNIISKASGQEYEVVEEWCRVETFFTPQECVSYGLADEIIKPLKVKGKKKGKKK
jgi:ATP-dependent Clp protease protease subunit